MLADRFTLQLRMQLSFIRHSAALYDQGEHLEAIRIATSLRVLFHHTARSTSLLTHLGAQETPIVSSTRGPSQPGVNGFAGTVNNFDGVSILNSWPPQPKLGRTSSPPRGLPAPEWWTQTVIVLNKSPL